MRSCKGNESNLPVQHIKFPLKELTLKSVIEIATVSL